MKKSIQHKLKPIIVVNKIDRNSTNLEEIITGVENLICEVADDISYLDNSVLFCSALKGYCYDSLEDIGKEDKKKNISHILDKVIEVFEPPKVKLDDNF